MNTPVGDTELHAWIDGELPPHRAALVEAALVGDPTLAARAEAFRADKLVLMTAYGPLLDAPIPAALRRVAEPTADPPTPVRASFWQSTPRRRAFIFAGAAALAAAIVLALLPHAPAAPAIEQALSARDNARPPSRELDGDDPATLEAAGRTMSDMLGNRTTVPDLRRAGFKLLSADIYGHPRAQAVQLRYEDATGRRFTVFLRPSAGSDAFEVTARGPVRLCLWQNADITAVMSGVMSTPELFRLASMTYASLGL